MNDIINVPTQIWQRAKQRPTQFNSNKNKPGVDYKEVAWVPPVVDTDANMQHGPGFYTEGSDEPTVA